MSTDTDVLATEIIKSFNGLCTQHISSSDLDIFGILTSLVNYVCAKLMD